MKYKMTYKYFNHLSQKYQVLTINFMAQDDITAIALCTKYADKHDFLLYDLYNLTQNKQVI